MTDLLGIPVYEGDFIAMSSVFIRNETSMHVGIVTRATERRAKAIYLSLNGEPRYVDFDSGNFVRVPRFDVPKDVRDTLIKKANLV